MTTYSTLYICHDLGSSDRAKEKPCIGFTQGNSIEFLVQCIYLIYARLIVHATQVLAYSKDHMYYMLLVCSMCCGNC